MTPASRVADKSGPFPPFLFPCGGHLYRYTRGAFSSCVCVLFAVGRRAVENAQLRQLRQLRQRSPT